MIKEKVRKPGDKRLLTAVVAAVLVLLTALYVTLELLINAGIISVNNAPPPGQKPELKDGEAYYGSSTVAYPTFDREDIQFIDIKAENGSFSLLRPDKKEEFILYYEDADGSTVPYVPPIVGVEGSFDYSQLFAFDSSSGLAVPKIAYLCVALGILYFNADARIELKDDTRDAQLRRYGLDEGSYDEITVTYLDEDGKEKVHVLKIGDSLLTGSGYYYMVDDREFIYTSQGKGLDYALGGFEAFIHSRVVASGLAVDGAYEPFLTTSYKQWRHTVHDTVGETVIADSEVVVSAARLDPDYDGKGGEDGYYRQSYDKLSMDLSLLAEREEYGRAVSVLLASKVGEYKTAPLILSIITERMAVELSDGASDEYRYEIVAIESFIFDDGEESAQGSTAGAAKFARVSYNLYVNDEKVNEKLYHGVFDISDESTMDSDARAKLRAASVGALNESDYITYEKVYTEENTAQSLFEYVITDIVTIYDESYKPASKIDDKSKVVYRYVIRVDGKEIGAEQQATVDLAAITEGQNLEIKQKLVGKSVQSDLNLVAISDERYGQDVFTFITYEISEIKYFVDKEIISSFKFINSVDRDPFFGESLYKNTLDNENKSYALNSEVCELVVKTLGGVASNTSDGLLGARTVAIGLTPTNMEKYGLYKNSIYFELPRGISASASGSSYTSIDSYTYVSTLGFYLYVSDEQPDGKRYVGSDMYDIIVEMDGSVFDFVEHSFVEYWARRSLVMLNYEHIDYVKLDLSMTDLYGSYNFDLDHKTIYIDSSGNHYDEKPESGGSEYDFVTVNVTPSGNCTENALIKWLRHDQAENPTLNINSIKLHNLYNRESETGDAGIMGDDYTGTAYFKEQLLVMFSTYYTGTLTDEEQREALRAADKLMSLTFAVDTSRAGPAASPYPYVYDFYRVSDRRIMVVIREIGPNGQTLSQVSDFYISQFAFRKIVFNFVNLLNGKPVDPDTAY